MSKETVTTPKLIELIARIIDPEAFGLPVSFIDLTDRDEAREKAKAIIGHLT